LTRQSIGASTAGTAGRVRVARSETGQPSATSTLILFNLLSLDYFFPLMANYELTVTISKVHFLDIVERELKALANGLLIVGVTGQHAHQTTPGKSLLIRDH
jgi:hypothetical protein